jgi:hypothetical protein
MHIFFSTLLHKSNNVAVEISDASLIDNHIVGKSIFSVLRLLKPGDIYIVVKSPEQST